MVRELVEKWSLISETEFAIWYKSASNKNSRNIDQEMVLIINSSGYFSVGMLI